MGSVYLAEDERLGRRIALKEILGRKDETQRDSQRRHALAREARLIGGATPRPGCRPGDMIHGGDRQPQKE